MNNLIVFLLSLAVLLQNSFAFDCTRWRFTYGPTLRPGPKHKEQKYTLEVSDQGRWVEPVYPPKKLIVIPSGICPTKWYKEPDFCHLESATNHHLDLQYWYRWPGSLINVELETDLVSTMNGFYFERIEEAIRIGLFDLARSYNLTLNFEEEKKGLFYKIKEHFNF